jgi:type III restriction enzyme
VLVHIEGRFCPGFGARLTDGRLFIVEYKGAHLIGAPDEREKTLLGKLWARKTGNVFATVRKALDGVGFEGQLRNAVAGPPH